MPIKRKIICSGTRKNRNGEVISCNRIIAEIEYANDVHIEIKCGSCGTMNVIEAKPKDQARQITKGLGTFPITNISI
ncbi:MAG TPA: hypothetical protein VIJ57_08510 [Hanamia sp.]